MDSASVSPRLSSAPPLESQALRSSPGSTEREPSLPSTGPSICDPGNHFAASRSSAALQHGPHPVCMRNRSKLAPLQRTRVTANDLLGLVVWSLRLGQLSASETEVAVFLPLQVLSRKTIRWPHAYRSVQVLHMMIVGGRAWILLS